MKKIIFFVFSTLLVGIMACTSEKGEIPQPIEGCISDTVIHTVSIAIADNSFAAQSGDILVGDTIVWTNGGTTPHTVTCNNTTGSILPAGATAFDSGIGTPIVAGGGTFKTAMLAAGNYTYVCLYHAPGMSGTIVVKPRCQ